MSSVSVCKSNGIGKKKVSYWITKVAKLANINYPPKDGWGSAWTKKL